MIEARGDHIQQLFAQALKLPRGERRAFLDRESGGDAGVRAIVEALVEAHEESPAAAAAAAKLSDPERIGPYRVERKIGEGGMGTVYIAEQTEPLRRTVALKVIKRGMDTDEVLARFEHERQSLALMNHAGIAQVHDAGATADGRPYFVMEHVPGLAITEYCDQNQLAVSERIELFLDVCAAVQHAHQKGIIHRDLKPSNILVTLHDGVALPKIIDFGLAKSIETRLTDRTVATRLGQIMGTPGYMSPEQMDIAAPDVDTRSDVYALGVILYELLVGVLPFDPDSLHAAGYVEVQRIIRTVEPPRPSTRFSMLNDASEVTARARGTDTRTLARHLRGDLDWIVMRCLEKDRARRYASASELAADLERHLDHEPVLAGPPSRAYRLKKFVRKNRGLVAATALVFAALTTGLAVASYGLIEANRQRGIAEGALVDTRNARDAEKERATQLQQVADFQGEQLSGIDVPLMGIRLRKGLLDGVRAASERGRHTEEETAARVAEVEKLIAGANFTDLAVASLNENIFETTRKTIDTQFATQPLVQAQLLQTLADTLRRVGLHSEALLPQERALAMRREHLGNEHRDTLRSISAMGVLLERLGRSADAEPLTREALETRRRVLSEEDPDTLSSAENMGTLLEARDSYAEAQPFYEEVLRGRLRVLGSEDRDTLLARMNLASLLESQGKLAEAEIAYRELLPDLRRVLGAEDRLTTTVLNDMAVTLGKLRKLPEAEVLFREGLETSRRLYGNYHPETLISVGNMATLLSNQGKSEEAERYFRESMDGLRQVSGNNAPDTLTAIHNFALFLRKQNKSGEAEPLLREVLGTRRRVQGDAHPDTLGSMHSLATVLRDLGRLDDAELLSAEAVRRGREVLPPGNPYLGIFLSGHGHTLIAMKRYESGIQALEEAHGILLAVCGDTHSRVADVRQSLVAGYDAWHAAEPGAGHDAKAAEWRAKLPPEEAKPKEAAGD